MFEGLVETSLEEPFLEEPFLVDPAPTRGALPPVPEHLLVWEPTAQDELDWRASLDRMDPITRFEVEHGRPAVPERARILGSSSEEVAAAAQQVAVDAVQMRTIAEAHRMSALLTAFESSMDDLMIRFGTRIVQRGGLGEQAFTRSFGLLSGMHPNQVSYEVTTALVLRDRLPLTWAAFQQGRASWTRVQVVVRQADGLEDGRWPAFDAKAARLVVTSTRLKDDLRRTRERLQDDTAGRRARTTFERRRTSLEPGADGGAAFVAEGLASTWVPIDDALHRAAVAAHGVEGETRSIAALRHDLVADILHEGLTRFADAGPDVRVPARKPVRVQLILTVPALAWLGRTKEQAQLSGYGPIAMELAKDLAGSATSFIRVLTDPCTGVRLGMDRKVYSPPADLARWVRVRDGRSRFPGSRRAAHRSDIDHVREWQDGGRTDDGNLVTLDRSSHALKTAKLYQQELLDSGIVCWTDTWGNRFEDPPADPLDPAPPDLLAPPPLSDEDDRSPF